MEKPTLTKVVASGLLWSHDSLLLLRRARDFKGIKQGRGLWEPPGGVVEIDETIPETLHREVLEESGISLTTAPTLATVCHYAIADDALIAHRFHILYAVQLPEPESVRLSEEHADYCWIDSAERLTLLNMIPALEDVVRRALVEQGRAIQR